MMKKRLKYDNTTHMGHSGNMHNDHRDFLKGLRKHMSVQK